MAVVVLPTPPFWLAREITRGVMAVMALALCGPNEEYASDYRYLTLGETPDPNDSPVWIGLARDQLGIDLPRFRGCGQFSLYILSLWKQPDRARFQQRIGVAEQFFQRRDRTRRDDLELHCVAAGKVLDSLRVHNGRQAKRVGTFAQERGFLLRAFDQMDLRASVSASAQAITKPGKPAPEPKSIQRRAFGASGRSWSESATCRVQIFGIVDGAIRFIVALALEHQRHERVEPRPCFT